jgi:hypothetical protein
MLVGNAHDDKASSPSGGLIDFPPFDLLPDPFRLATQMHVPLNRSCT